MTSELSPKLKASEPVNFFKKSLAADWKQLTAAVAKAIGHGAIGGWAEAASNAADAVGAIGLNAEPEELVFILIKRALVSAMLGVLAEAIEVDLAGGKVNVNDFTEKMNFDELNIEVDSSFFDNPGSLDVVRKSGDLIAGWLKGVGVNQQSAANASARLPVYFAYALNSEWRKNQKFYRPVLDYFSSPFLKAGEKEWAWSEYFSLLRKRVNEPVFDEPFGLDQIYVPLNAYYAQDKDKRENGTEMAGRPTSQSRVVVSLEAELLRWLTVDDQSDVLRVISGGPGSGKSSFSKMFAAQLCGNPLAKPLFIPLHLIDPTKDLVEEVGRFIRDEGVLIHNPLILDGNECDLLIIFDGLDELASQGKAAAETARAFVREVDRVVHRINLNRIRLRVLISGREVIIQENESEFRRPCQILNVLPYYSGLVDVSEGRARLSSEPWIVYDDPQGILSVDFREEWWARYGALTGRGYEQLPKPLRRTDLDEVTSQPLLNYLVALSYTRKKIDFSKDVNLNSVYADLVAAVHERGYEKRGSYGPIRHIKVIDFVRVLEEIGLAAWHGDGRSTTVREIEEHCKKSGLGALLALFQEGAQAGVTKLLAAFFFRQHGQRSAGDPTFVFTHKSFGEYLAARRIVRAIDRVCRELDARANDLDTGWDERDALKHWIEITGPSEVSAYLHPFLVNEISLKDVETVSSWQRNLAKLFSHVLKYGIPMEMVQVSPFKEELFQARNAEETLLAALSACSRKIKKIAEIIVGNPTAFGAWFKRIQGQRTSPESALAARCLSYLGLSDSALDVGDYYGADFSHSDLTGVAAHYACFIRANFSNAILDGAIFTGSNMEGANLNDASAINLNLSEAKISGAKFVGANLAGARFDKVPDSMLSDEQLSSIRIVNLHEYVDRP